MSNVIKFKNPKPVKSQRPRIEAVDCLKNFLYLGLWEFTCPNCSRYMKFNSTGMIFRNIELHCDKCGAMHRITNPAFASISK